MILFIWILISMEVVSDLECHSDILTWALACHSDILIMVMAMVIPIMVTVTVIPTMATLIMAMVMVVAAITTTAATCTIPITNRYTMDLAGQLNRTGWLHPALPLLQTHDA
jgi:hypothetical protein